jgi:hypothetical protein
LSVLRPPSPVINCVSVENRYKVLLYLQMQFELLDYQVRVTMSDSG